MAWEKINEMFPSGGTNSTMGYLTNEQIVAMNLPKVELIVMRPVRNMLDYREKLVYYPNGNMDRYYIESVFPYENIDGTPLLNIFGQKVLNNIMEGKYNA